MGREIEREGRHASPRESDRVRLEHCLRGATMSVHRQHDRGFFRESLREREQEWKLPGASVVRRDPQRVVRLVPSLEVERPVASTEYACERRIRDPGVERFERKAAIGVAAGRVREERPVGHEPRARIERAKADGEVALGCRRCRLEPRSNARERRAVEGLVKRHQDSRSGGHVSHRARIRRDPLQQRASLVGGNWSVSPERTDS
jgi:hypothetical protein